MSERKAYIATGASRGQRKAPTGTISGHTLATDWQTPPELLDLVRAYFGGLIPFDAATSPDNPTRAVEFSTHDGLTRDWPQRVWVNPPYGKALRDWMAKIASEARRGREIVALLPAARFEQKYFQDAFALAEHVTWIRKRVRFIRPQTGERVSGNPYANMFVGWNTQSNCAWIRTIGQAGLTQHVSGTWSAPRYLEQRGAIPVAS